MARTKSTQVKEIHISRTVDFTVTTFPTVDAKAMQIVQKEVKLPGTYTANEILPALLELGHMPAAIPTMETVTSVYRWKLSKILPYGEELKKADDDDDGPKTRTRKGAVKEIFITRTVDFTLATFPTVDAKAMQIVQKEVKLPGTYTATEILPALLELGHMPAAIPTMETVTSVYRWKLSKILPYGEEMKNIPEYIPGEEE